MQKPPGVHQEPAGKITMQKAMSALMRKPLMHVLLMVVLIVAAYANALQAPFVLDDESSIVNNDVIKDLDNFFTKAKGYDHSPNRFIGYLTFALNYKFGGLDVRGYHIVNIAVHLVNAVLLYFLVVLTCATPHLRISSLAPRAGIVAFFTALFFAVHPIQTQAVTYLVQRMASLATTFILASVVLYASSRLTREREARTTAREVVLYLLSVIAAVLAMKTKEIAFILPVIVVLYEWFFFPRGSRRSLVFLAPMLLTLFIIPLSLLDISQPLSEVLADARQVTRVQTVLSRGDYLMTQFVVIIRYIGLLLMPISQNLDYDQRVYGSFLAPAVFASFLVLLSAFAAAVYLFVRSRGNRGEGRPEFRFISFGILWFFIALSVESSIIPIADVMFEHRVYLPSAGFFIAGTTAVFLMKDRLAAKGRRTAYALVPGMLAAVVLLFGATVVRNDIWRDGVRLWQDAVGKSPAKARPYYNLGVSYERARRLQDAVRAYQAAIQRNPGYLQAHNNLGNVYLAQGRIDDAIRAYQAAIAAAPGVSAHAHDNLGYLYFSLGRYEDAVREYQAAIRIEPGRGEIHNNLGYVYLAMERLEDAVGEFGAALALDPGLETARSNLAATLMQRDRIAGGRMRRR